MTEDQNTPYTPDPAEFTPPDEARRAGLDAGEPPATAGERKYVLGDLPEHTDDASYDQHGWAAGAARMMRKPVAEVTANDASRFRLACLSVIMCANRRVRNEMFQLIDFVLPDVYAKTPVEGLVRRTSLEDEAPAAD